MEVEWGLSQEARILRRWVELSEYGRGGVRIVDSHDFDDFDRIVFDKTGLPVAYVEIKCRKSPFSRFGDAIFPQRKHDFARRLRAFNLPFLGVTEYGCGTLVEVDLSTPPARFAPIKRRDRNESVRHVFYLREQLTILEGAA